jgi:4-amino-4-deoxy-L-arabinose transferase-like glycosyltransferase
MPEARRVPAGGRFRVRVMPVWVAPLAVAIAFAVFASMRIQEHGLFDNEGRYAEVAREMLEREDWVTPEMNGTLFLNKPPLMFWLAASAFGLGAAGEQVRLASIGVSAVGVFLTGLLGARLFDGPTGVLGALALATMFGFGIEARTLRPDSVLVTTVVAALLCWRVAMDRPAARRTAWFAGAAAALATGFMAKGAVPVVIAVVPMVVCTVRDLGWRGLRQLRPLLWIGVFLALVGPWHVLVAWRHPGFAWDYLVNQHIMFFLGRKYPPDSEGTPLSVFWLVFVVRSLPWAVLMPFTATPAWHGLRSDAPEPDRASALCWLWLAGVMLPFSLSPSRLEHYSLPALPAAALLAAHGWSRLAGGLVSRAGWLWLGAFAAVLVTAGALGSLWGAAWLAKSYWLQKLPQLLGLVHPAALTLLLGGALLALAVRTRRAGGVPIALALLAVPMMVILMRAQAGVEAVFSWRPLAREIAARIPPTAEVVFGAGQEYQQVGGLAFYTGRHITVLEPPGGFTPPSYLVPVRDTLFCSRSDFTRRWLGPELVAFVSDPQKRRDSPMGLVPGPFHVVARSGDRWLLVNHPLPDAPAP